MNSNYIQCVSTALSSGSFIVLHKRATLSVELSTQHIHVNNRSALPQMSQYFTDVSYCTAMGVCIHYKHAET